MEANSATKPRKRSKAKSVVVEPPEEALDGRDRRKHPRRPLERPAKLFMPKSGRFLAGSTRNLSVGGVLVVAEADARMEPGDAIHMTVAFGERFIVPMSELVPGTIVRVDPCDDPSCVTLAIAYDSASETAMAA